MGGNAEYDVGPYVGGVEISRTAIFLINVVQALARAYHLAPVFHGNGPDGLGAGVEHAVAAIHLENIVVIRCVVHPGLVIPGPHKPALVDKHGIYRLRAEPVVFGNTRHLSPKLVSENALAVGRHIYRPGVNGVDAKRRHKVVAYHRSLGKSGSGYVENRQARPVAAEKYAVAEVYDAAYHAVGIYRPRDYAIVGKAEVMQIVMGGQPKAVAAGKCKRGHFVVAQKHIAPYQGLLELVGKRVVHKQALLRADIEL